MAVALALWVSTAHAATPESIYGDLKRVSDSFDSSRAILSALEKGKERKALKQYLSTKSEAGDRGISLLILAHLARMQGKTEEALEHYRRAQEISDKPSLIKHCHGLYLSSLGRQQEALGLLEEALGLAQSADSRWLIFRNAIDIAVRLGDRESLRDLYAKGRELKIADSLSLVAEEAEALTSLGPLDAAESLWRQVIESTNYKKDAYLRAIKALGKILERKGAHKEAMGLYRETLRRLPRDHWMRTELLDHLVEVHRQQGTLEKLLRAIPKLAKGFEGDMTRARVLEELGQQQKAARVYEALVRKFPYAPEPYARLAHILKLRGDHQRVAALLRSQVKKMPGEIGLVFQLARVLGDLGKKKDAVKLLNKTANRLNHDPGIQAEVTDLLIRLKAPRKAVLARFARLRKLEPRDPTHVEALGSYLYGQHLLEDARKVWFELISVLRTPADGHLRLAKILQEHHFSEYAEKHYAKALELAPDELDILGDVAAWREKSHAPEDALNLWNRIVQMDPDVRHEVTRSAIERIIELHVDAGTLREKVQTTEESISEQDPPRLAESILLIRSLGRTGAVDQALKRGETLSAQTKQARVLLQTMLELARNSGRHEIVLGLIAKLVKLDVHASSSLALERAEILMRLGRNDEARSETERVLGQSQNDPEILVRLADLQEEMGDFRRAIAILQRAQSLHPDTMPITFKLANLYRRLGETDHERQTLQRVVRVAHRSLDIHRAGRRLIQLARNSEHLNELDRVLSPILLRSGDQGTNRSLWLDIQLRRARIHKTDMLTSNEQKTLNAEQPSSFRHVAEALAEEDTSNRIKALEILAHAPPPGVERFLARCLSDPDEEIRLRCFQVLGKNPSAKTYALLWDKVLKPEVQNDVDLPTYLGALWALGRTPLSVEIDWEKLSEPNLQRNATLGLLMVASMRRDPGAIPLIEDNLENPKALVRAAAIFALTRLENTAPEGLVEATLNTLTSEKGIALMSVRNLAISQPPRIGGPPLARALIEGVEEVGRDLRALYSERPDERQASAKVDAGLSRYWEHALSPSTAQVNFEPMLRSSLAQGLASRSTEAGELHSRVIPVITKALEQNIKSASSERRARIILRLARAGNALRLDTKGEMEQALCKAQAEAIRSTRKRALSPREIRATIALVGDCVPMLEVRDFAVAFDAASRPLKEQILRRISAHPERTPSHLRSIADGMKDSGLQLLWLSQAKELGVPPDDERLIEWLQSAPWSLTLAVLEYLRDTKDRRLSKELFAALEPSARTQDPRVQSRLLETLCRQAPEKESRWPQWMVDLAKDRKKSPGAENIFCSP